MDPLGDLFSFISNNDVNEDIETKRPSLSKSCNLCKEGKVHGECTTNQRYKTRGKKTDGEYACEKCEYTCDKKMRLRYHIEEVHIKVKNLILNSAPNFLLLLYQEK